VGCRSLRRSRLPASLHLRWKLRLQQGTCYPSGSDRDNYPHPMGGCRCTLLCSDGPSDYPLGRCSTRLFPSSPYILLVAPVRTLRKRLSLSRCLTSAAWLVEPRSGGYHHFQLCPALQEPYQSQAQSCVRDQRARQTPSSYNRSRRIRSPCRSSGNRLAKGFLLI
jgi:hypothetical protein